MDKIFLDKILSIMISYGVMRIPPLFGKSGRQPPAALVCLRRHYSIAVCLKQGALGTACLDLQYHFFGVFVHRKFQTKIKDASCPDMYPVFWTPT